MNSKTSVKTECAAQVNMTLQLQQTIYLGTKQNIAWRPMVMKRHFTQGAEIRLFSQPPTQHSPLKSLIILIFHHAFSSSWNKFPDFPLGALLCYSAGDGLCI